MRNRRVVNCLRALMGTGISRNEMLAERSARHNGTKVLGLADKVQRCWHLGTSKRLVAAPFSGSKQRAHSAHRRYPGNLMRGSVPAPSPAIRDGVSRKTRR